MMTNYGRNFDSLVRALFGRVGEGQNRFWNRRREHLELTRK